jgi:ABC-type multidrug transport system fused ATPase/permease subunit
MERSLLKDSRRKLLTSSTILDDDEGLGERESQSNNNNAEVEEGAAAVAAADVDLSRATADTSTSLYHYYQYWGLKWVFWAIIPSSVALCLANQLVSLYVAVWSGDYFEGWSMQKYAAVYLAIGVVGVMFSFVRQLLVAYRSVEGSRKMHDSLLTTVLAAQLSFFQTTPSGDIVSRFSEDMNVCDQELPDNIQSVMQRVVDFFLVLFVLVGLKVSTIFILIPVAAAITIFFYRFFPSTITIAKLFSSLSSPTVAVFQETLGGLESVRATSCGSETVQREHEAALETQSHCKWLQFGCGRFVRQGLDFLGVFAVLGISCLCIFTKTGESAALTGVLISFSMTTMAILTWGLQGLTETLVCLLFFFFCLLIFSTRQVCKAILASTITLTGSSQSDMKRTATSPESLGLRTEMWSLKECQCDMERRCPLCCTI